MERDATKPVVEVRLSTLDPRALGLTGGLTLAGWVVIIGVLSRISWGDRWRRLFADLYPGYSTSPLGLLIGAVWAFVDGFTAGAVFALLYNRLVR